MKCCWRLLTLLFTAVLAVVWHPASQCLLLNVVDPWMTQTMWERIVEQTRQSGRPMWIAQRDVVLKELPREVPEAILSGEDQRFFEHSGFDWEAIEQAWDKNQAGGKIRGASTISQQVARNVFLWQDRTWLRKGLEAWYTVWLELCVPKRRILEIYLNIAETGPMTFGIDAAARHWYEKPAAKLTLREAASIAAILPSPRSRSPKSPLAVARTEWIVANRVTMPRE